MKLTKKKIPFLTFGRKKNNSIFATAKRNWQQA